MSSTDRTEGEAPRPLAVVTYHGYFPLSAELIAEAERERALFRDAWRELMRICAIGPVHGPPEPPRFARRREIRRRVPGHPTGTYRTGERK